MEKVQTLVVGAGVVGLACARALARSGREVIVAEAASAIGTGTSSRNSEVVHAGIYYPAGSLKARHCVQGAKKLLDFCKERDVGHRVCGKLIVATSDSQREDLAKVTAKAALNGVQLYPLSAADVRSMEPEVSCVAALHSPGTAIVDSHGFMQALLADAEDAGASVVCCTRVRHGGCVLPDGSVTLELETLAAGAAESFQLKAQEVVNCAGLAAPRVACAVGVPGGEVPQPHFCKGSYYALQGPGCTRPFSRLVYPIPEKNTSGLGVHATVDLAGQVRFGPDVEWLPAELRDGVQVDTAAYGKDAVETYAVDTSRSAGFYREVRRYWPGPNRDKQTRFSMERQDRSARVSSAQSISVTPGLPDGALVADYSGIRPKLSGPGEAPADFHIAVHRAAPGHRSSVVSLFGIESPGLTASLSLADEVLQHFGSPP